MDKNKVAQWCKITFTSVWSIYFFTLFKAPIIFIWDLSSSGPSLIWALRQSPTLPWAGCQIDVAWASPPSSNAGRALPRGAWHACAHPSCRPSASCSPPPPPTLAARRSFPWNALHPTCDKNSSNLTLKQGSRENLKTIESIIRETFPRITVFLLVWLTPTRLDTACKRMKFSKVFFHTAKKWQIDKTFVKGFSPIRIPSFRLYNQVIRT